MRVSEEQLLVLLGVVKDVIKGELILEPDIRLGLAKLYEQIMHQQNEVVDTSNFPNPTRDQYLRLVYDMFEAFEGTVPDPEDFYKSPMGKRALAIMYPGDAPQKKACGYCHGTGEITKPLGHFNDRCPKCKGKGFTFVEKEDVLQCSDDS
jgi:hypothetical protein